MIGRTRTRLLMRRKSSAVTVMGHFSVKLWLWQGRPVYYPSSLAARGGLPMQGLEIEAVYEKGNLKLPRELPLVEGATVRITIHPPGRPGIIKHVQIPWTGSQEEFDRWLNDPDEGLW